MAEIIDLTSSPEPEPKANPHVKISRPLPSAQMPLRQSPHKRQKVHHVRDDGDEGQDGEALLSQFKARSTQTTRTGLNGNNGTSSAREALSCEDRSASQQQQSAQSQRSSWNPFSSSMLAALKGLGDSFGTAPTIKKKNKKLTKEQAGPAPAGHRQNPNGSVVVPPTSAHDNRARTVASGSVPPRPRMPGQAMYNPVVVPQNYPHGLPLPRSTTRFQPSAGAGTRPPLPPPSPPPPPPPYPPARPATVSSHPAYPLPRPNPASLPRLAPTPMNPSKTSNSLPSRSNPPPARPTNAIPPSSAPHTASPITVRPKASAYPTWTEEEDSLIIYLKHGLGWSWPQIMPLLTGRSKGAANTRFCNRLKYGYDMRKAIEILRNSRWANVLEPEKHTELLARPAATATEQGIQPNPALASITAQNPSGTTIASQRERRNAERPTNYYTKEYYPNANTNVIEVDVPSEPEKTVDRPRNNDSTYNAEHAGVEVSGIRKRKSHQKRRYRSYRPYLSYQERLLLQHGQLEEGDWDPHEFDAWKGTKLHVPFTREELNSLEFAICSKFDIESLKSALEGATEPEILEWAGCIRSLLPTRTKESIEAFLRDAADNRQSQAETLLLQGQKPGVPPSIDSILRNRELGMRTPRRDYSKSKSIIHLQTRVFDSIGPSLSYTGTSGDVNTVAWAPNGLHFAAGSACLVDSDSMQYNRPNNLLFGDLASKTLREIPNHYTHRERPETGVNSSRSMHVTQDPRLFQTVSMVAFSPDSSLLFSAGYDETVRIYNVASGTPDPHCPALRHIGKVDLLSVSMQGLIATGCQRFEKNSIKVINPSYLSFAPENLIDENGNRMKPVMHNFSSKKAAERPENGIFPSALRFDPHSGDYLLAGFTSTLKEESMCGETCLWDLRTGTQLSISPETRNVFDVAWNGNRWSAPLFAVGCAAGSNVNRGVRSVIKMYDPRSPGKYGMPLELDCPALDMNDVLYCPYDDNFIVAGCTNGKTYVWDIRKHRPEEHLYSLAHGKPLMELGDDDPASRERLDTGIRFCSWGYGRRQLYTGSSDGVLKEWDLYRAPEDVFSKDIVQLNSGIMSGAFSPDYTSLLLGEVNGTINTMEAGKSDRSIKDTEPFDFIGSSEPPIPSEESSQCDDADSGIAAAKHLLETDQMILRPMGSVPIRQAVQGPEYKGPWDNAEDAQALRKAAVRFQDGFSSLPTVPCELPGCRDAASKLVPEEAGDSGRSADRIPGALRSLGLATREQKKRATTIAPTLKCSRCHARPARPRVGDADSENEGAKPVCERCSFSCLRCGEPALLHNNAKYVYCPQCRGLWRADVLGYRLLHMADWDDNENDTTNTDLDTEALLAMYASPRRKKKANQAASAKENPASPTKARKKERKEATLMGMNQKGWSKPSAKQVKKNRRETALEKDRRKGHDYLVEAEGDDCVKEYYHGLWEDRPASPL